MTSPAFKPEPVIVAGRRFIPSTSTTFDQDIYVMQLVSEAGLDELAKEFSVDIGELSDVSQRIIITAFVRGKLFELLGAVMEEEGVEWTMETAKENGEFFRRLRATEDKLALRGAIVSVVLGFFISGLLSSASSATSLSINGSPDVPLTASEPNDIKQDSTEDITTSAIGT